MVIGIVYVFALAQAPVSYGPQVPSWLAWLQSVALALSPFFPQWSMPLYSGLVATLVAISALRVNAGINLRNKRLDVILQCDARYDDLYKLRIELIARSWPGVAPIMDDEHAAYFKRYWALKSDQFDYWLSGYVDQETITSWMMSTADSLQGIGHGEAALDYRGSLHEMHRSHAVINRRFVDLIKFIDVYVRNIDGERHRDCKYAVLLHYMRIIEKQNCRLIRQLSRSSFRRLRMPEFADTLLQPYRGDYVTVSPASLLSRWADVVLRILRTPVMAYWHEWRARMQLKTLEDRLKKEFQAVSKAAELAKRDDYWDFPSYWNGEAGAAFAAPGRQRLQISVWLLSSRWIRRQ